MKSVLLIVLYINVILAQQEVGLAPGLYCGLESCYDVILLKRDDFTKTQLSKVYRKLAKEFHPDRQPDEELKKNAETKFRQIATAYEVLKDDETRQLYDHYLDHPEDRYYNYYQYYKTKAAPKIHPSYVVLITIIFVSVFQYYIAKHKSADALKQACSVQKFRNRALQQAIDAGLIKMDKRGKVIKDKGQNIDDIICEIIKGNMHISEATIYDTIIFQILLSPVQAYHYLIWVVTWYYKYSYMGQEYSEKDRIYVLCQKVGISEDEYNSLEPNKQKELENEAQDTD
uniref:J domain-containing protein n=1 Tax=Rhabditophanes sp. KR3021 TaxID=114890 RepID=A0AC35UH71_9BILA